ncbi:hypothetical protein GC173_02650 [bacterium]|nr:hypothetical protein [bacterium]
MNIAFIGIGKVGAALAEALSRAGNQILVGAKPDSASAREVTSANPHYNHLPPEAAVARASVVFLATPFGAAEEALKPLAESLAGKILVDCTNPVGAGLSHALDSRTSGSELIQRLVPGARVVKAFTVYGYENFADAQYPGYGSLLPGMPITGDDPGAKRVVARLCRQVGFEAIDAGALSCSVHLEHATLLWIKMARVNGYGNGFTWGFLRRENR